MKEKDKKKKVERITKVLFDLYPDAECSLEFVGDPYRLLVMARLSAQCTDARVNIVSRELFAAFPTVFDMAKAPLCEIEDIVRPCGLFRTKAKSIKEASEILVEKHGGNVPSDMDELLSLPGVGRKIANLIRGDYFGLGGIVADTHCIRITERLGLCKNANPTTVERTLDPIVPKEVQSAYCHRMVYFGRDICKAQNPRCDTCPLKDECEYKRRA